MFFTTSRYQQCSRNRTFVCHLVKNYFIFSISADSSFLLANAQIAEYPIVYCNESFCKISGYNRAEVMQKSCRCTFMFGELTDKETISRIDHVLEHQLHDQFEILLYKKNSEYFIICLPFIFSLTRFSNRSNIVFPSYNYSVLFALFELQNFQLHNRICHTHCTQTLLRNSYINRKYFSF